MRLAGLELTSAQLDNFENFEESLYAANQVMNLTRVPQEEAWLRHFLDSLLFADFIPVGGKLLDIGTGPGFPAWPLANARPDLQVTALDSSGKMTGFLASQPLPKLEVVQSRAEDWERREEFDVVTGRAVAPLEIQLEISAPACRVGGKLILMRTPNDEFKTPHLDWLGLKPPEMIERTLPGEEIKRVFPIYEKTKATPRNYPRSWAEIKRAPFHQSQ